MRRVFRPNRGARWDSTWASLVQTPRARFARRSSHTMRTGPLATSTSSSRTSEGREVLCLHQITDFGRHGSEWPPALRVGTHFDVYEPTVKRAANFKGVTNAVASFLSKALMLSGCSRMLLCVRGEREP
eukprot:1898651-Pleurochrysis_carterae.AAC.2